MNTIIYTNGGDNYHGEKDLTDRELKELKQEEKESGSIGYMIGKAHWNGNRVIVFFQEKPENLKSELHRRRENGFVGARWFDL